MAGKIRESEETSKQARIRREEIIRSPDGRRQFAQREAHTHLQHKEARWAPVAYGVFFAAMLAIFAVAYTSYAFSKYRGDILPGVYVDRTSLGGLTPSQAMTEMTRQWSAIGRRPVDIRHGNVHWDPSESDIGLSYGFRQTADLAMNIGRKGTFLSQLLARLPVHPTHHVALQFDVKSRVLLAYLRRAVVTPLQHGHHARNAQLWMEQKAGKIMLNHSQSGIQVDLPALAISVQSALGHLTQQSRQVPIRQVPPQISDADALPFQRRVEAFLAHPPVINIGKRVFVSSRVDFGPAFSFTERPAQRKIELNVDPNVVRAYVHKLALMVNRPAQNARVRFFNGSVTEVQPRRTGRQLDEVATSTRLLSVVAGLKPNARLHVPIAVTQPPIDNSNPTSFGINQLLSTGTTSFAGASPARLNDITAIAKTLDGDLIQPKQDISFNFLVGTNWPDQVYADQEAASNGPSAPGDGGGMQQVATTFLRAMYAAGLTLTERHAHAYRLPWYEPPIGFDAEVAPARNWDLQFHNNTGKYLLIGTRVEPIKQELYIYVYGPKLGWHVAVDSFGKVLVRIPPPPKKVVQSPDLAPHEVQHIAFAHFGGTTVLQRTITYPNGNVTVDELRTTYAPHQAIEQVGSAVTLTTPTPVAGAHGQKTRTVTPGAQPSPTPTFSH